MIDNRIPQLNPTGIAHSHVVQSFGAIKRKGRPNWRPLCE